jgi:hypothetical protein
MRDESNFFNNTRRAIGKNLCHAPHDFGGVVAEADDRIKDLR